MLGTHHLIVRKLHFLFLHGRYTQSSQLTIFDVGEGQGLGLAGVLIISKVLQFDLFH